MTKQRHQSQGFIISATSFDRNQRAQVQLWLSTPEGPAKLQISDQRPLFFIAQSDQNQALALIEAFVDECRPIQLQSFQQHPMLALYFRSIKDHQQALQQLSPQITVYEGDIKLHERYLFERFSYGSIQFVGEHHYQKAVNYWQNLQIKPSDYQAKLSLLSLDIECSPSGELYSIGLYHQKFQGVIMIGEQQSCDMDIDWVSDETALLQQFISRINQLDPDLIIGWNVINFDFKLLIERAKYRKINLSIGREQAQASWRERQQGQGGFVSVPGRIVVDGIDALKTATYHFDSFSLEFVAQALLERGKLSDSSQDKVAEINYNFKHNKLQLARYNLEDCKLVWDIFQHTDLISFLCLRAQLTGLPLDRQGGSVAAFNNVYIPKLHRANYVAPNLQRDFIADSPGGYVMNSRPGLYQHVLVLDFKSLYPSIIRTFKIDPVGLIEGLKHPEQAIEGFRGGKFSREQHFLPTIIEQLWQQRDQAKLNKDSARSQAIKILMNSFYGVLGSTGCRFHDPRLASSITMRGHQLMQETATWIEQQGYQVIYGDTDSTFVWLEGDYDPEKASVVGQQLAAGINQYWQQKIAQEMQLESHLEIEFETYFSQFLMPTIRGSETGSKKRYAGMSGDKLIIKGLETVRSDWTPLAKQFQTELLLQIFQQQNPSAYIKQTIKALLAGELDKQLIYRKRLRRKLSEYVKNIPPQVRAALRADQQNQENGLPLRYQQRGRIEYLVTLQGPEAIEYQSSAIDYQHYLDKQIRPIAEAILPFIGLDFETITSQQIALF